MNSRLTVNFLPSAIHSSDTVLHGRAQEVHHRLGSLHLPDNNSLEELQIPFGVHQQNTTISCTSLPSREEETKEHIGKGVLGDATFSTLITCHICCQQSHQEEFHLLLQDISGKKGSSGDYYEFPEI